MASESVELENIKLKVTANGSKRSAAVQLSAHRKKNSMFDETALFQLAQEGKLEELKNLVDQFGLTLKGVDSKGRTLLHVSAVANQCEAMEYLISSGVELNAADNNGDTALHLAVSNQSTQAAQILLSHGADDTILNNQSEAPLHIAARNDHGAMVAAMLDYPISVDVRGSHNRNPIHVVAENDSIEVLKVFHNHVANGNSCKSCFRLCSKDDDDLTPIHIAARKGSHRVLECMMNWGKDHGYTAEQVLKFIDEENNTPLHTAVDGGHDEVVRILLSYGASPTESKVGQLSPIHLACSQGKLKMVELMVQFGGGHVIACKDVFGQTPLHSSTLPPSTAVLCYLINTGAQLNVCNNQGQTPLITATISGNLAAVKILLKSGADPLIKDQNGDNPLHYAVQRNRKAIASCLLDHPTTQQILIEKNHTGSCPVHYALQQGSSDLVSQMLKLLEGSLHEHRDNQGSNYLHLAALSGDWKTLSAIMAICKCHTFLNEINKDGSTPLHLATLGGHQRCVEILLSHGAMSHKCSCGLTPFLLACAKGHAECAKILYDAHPFQKNWSNDEGNNALHFAALARSPSCISLALDIGIPLTYNHKQESFLDIIINNVDSECALAVIQHDRWSECLHFKSPLHPYPMVGLVGKIPDAAKAVLDRCHTKSLLPRDNVDYWESYNFEPLKTDWDIYQGPHPQSEDVEKNSAVEQDMPLSLSTTVEYSSPVSINISAEEKSYDVLNKMAQLRRRTLLNHVVVDAYIKQKWNAYGYIIFMASLTIAFLQVLFLSIFVNSSFPVSQNVTQNVSSNPLSVGSAALAIITLLFTTLRTIWLFMHLISTGYLVLNISKNLSLWIGGASVVSSYVFLLLAIIRGYSGIPWTAGALAAFFGWFGVALELSLFDLFGIYVVMFLQVTRTLLLVICLCIPFLLAFGMSSYIVTSMDSNYSTVGYSVFTVTSYLLGQINFEQLIIDEDSGVLLSTPLVFILAILAAIILAIGFGNLLVGLAVGDIEHIRQTALVYRQASRIRALTYLEKGMPQCLKHKFNFVDAKIYPNKKVSLLKLMWRYCWRAVKNNNPEDEENVSDSQTKDEVSHEETLLRLKQQVEEMAERQERMMELLQQLHQPKELSK